MNTFDFGPKLDPAAYSDAYTIALRRAGLENIDSPDLYAACVIDLSDMLMQFVGRRFDETLRMDISKSVADWVKEKGERYDVG